jgi:hypothetical protein
MLKNFVVIQNIITFTSEMKKLPNSPNLRSVFTNIAEARMRRAYYDVFLNDSMMIIEDVKSSKDESWIDRLQLLGNYEEWLKEYKSMVHDPKFEIYLQRLRNLEIAILMYRSLAFPVMSIGEMKMNRGNSDKSYAFVRAPFYSPDNLRNEIRVYMGSMDEFSKTIEELKHDAEFLDRCEVELKKAMQKKLDEQIQILSSTRL